MNKKKSLLSRLISAPYLVWAAMFVIVPMLIVAYYAFTDAAGNFTVANIKKLSEYSVIFFRSILFSLIATVICLVIAYPIAYIISQKKGNKQRIFIMLLMLPMWMNFLIRTYAWQVILQDKGIINSFLGVFGIAPLKLMYNEGAVVSGMVYDFLPYMILPIYSVLCKLDFKLVEAALDLGCNHLGVLGRLIIPLSMPGVISGVTMVFVPSISTFYISQKHPQNRYIYHKNPKNIIKVKPMLTQS